jgi:hypothetical protein
MAPHSFEDRAPTLSPIIAPWSPSQSGLPCLHPPIVDRDYAGLHRVRAGSLFLFFYASTHGLSSAEESNCLSHCAPLVPDSRSKAPHLSQSPLKCSESLDSAHSPHRGSAAPTPCSVLHHIPPQSWPIMDVANRPWRKDNRAFDLRPIGRKLPKRMHTTENRTPDEERQAESLGRFNPMDGGVTGAGKPSSDNTCSPSSTPFRASNKDEAEYGHGLYPREYAAESAVSADDKLRARKCPFHGCAKVVCRTSYLKAHMRLHTRERPFECSMRGCAMRFRWKSNLTRHLRTAHDIVSSPSCSRCDYSDTSVDL